MADEDKLERYLREYRAAWFKGSEFVTGVPERFAKSMMSETAAPPGIDPGEYA